METLAGWAVTWRYRGQSHECDFVEQADANAFARGLAEARRADVLVVPLTIDMDAELVARSRERIQRAIASALP